MCCYPLPPCRVGRPSQLTLQVTNNSIEPLALQLLYAQPPAAGVVFEGITSRVRSATRDCLSINRCSIVMRAFGSPRAPPRGVTTWSSCLALCLPLHLVQILPRIDPHASVSIALSAVAVSGGWHRIDGLTIRSVAEAPTVVWSSGFSKAPPVHVQDS